MEEQRVKAQIQLLKEDLNKHRDDLQVLKKKTDNINEKCYDSRTYIRRLEREQACYNEKLTTI